MSGIEDIVAGQGFDCIGLCLTGDLTVRPEVRDMCSADLCNMYGRNWSCPPACGSLSDFEEMVSSFDRCLVVQTVAVLEDEFDVEGMQEAGDLQKARMLGLLDALREAGEGSNCMVLTAGACTVCPQCSYPHDACRFPERRLVSMEAAGLVVSEVCVSAGIPYNHGKNTITYSGCVLF